MAPGPWTAPQTEQNSARVATGPLQDQHGVTAATAETFIVLSQASS
jgi:hypothetical protein